MGYSSTRPHWLPLLPVKSRELKVEFAQIHGKPLFVLKAKGVQRKVYLIKCPVSVNGVNYFLSKSYVITDTEAFFLSFRKTYSFLFISTLRFTQKQNDMQVLLSSVIKTSGGQPQQSIT